MRFINGFKFGAAAYVGWTISMATCRVIARKVAKTEWFRKTTEPEENNVGNEDKE